MNRDDFDKHVQAQIARTADLLIKKGAEYAGDADRLANFKRNAAKNRQTVLECWQVYIGKHIDSVNSYVARVKNEAVRCALCEVAKDVESERYNVSPEFRREVLDPESFQKRVESYLPIAIARIDKELSEPIEGRFDDIINYCFLGSAIVKELQEEAAK